MQHQAANPTTLNRRVRAILLTERGTLLLIKRVKPDREPYYVAPGGGFEDHDANLLATLERELGEELGATADVVWTAFVLEHTIAGKNLQEHFFICRLRDYDLSKRHGPEFEDPTRGAYVPVEIPLDESLLFDLNLKTPELRDYLVDHVTFLQNVATCN